MRVGLDLPAEGDGGQLVPQTDPEEGPAGRDGAGDEPLGGDEVPVLDVVVGAHPSAQDDQTGMVSQPDGERPTVVGAQHVAPQARPGQPRLDHRCGGVVLVLHDEDPTKVGHVRILALLTGGLSPCR